MFSSQGASSPFRSSGQTQFAPQQSQQKPAQPQPFAQQGSSYGQSSPFGASSSSSSQQQQQSGLNGQSMYGTPQFGASNSWGGAGGSNSPSAFGQFGGQQQQQQQFGRGGQSGGTPGFGDKPRQTYLPGFLSSGNVGQAEATPPQTTGDDVRAWDSPVRRTSISGSPATRFGGQSLFGPRDGTPSRSPKATGFGRDSLRAPAGGSYRSTEMEEDAPPISSLGEYDGNDSMTSLYPDVSSHTRSTSPSDLKHASAPSAPTPGGYPVYIFGFPSSAVDFVVEHFAQFGEILSTTPSTEGGNWVTVAYAQPWSATRAARKNGEVLGGVLMVGVKVVDEDTLRRAMVAAEGGDVGASKVEGSSTPALRTTPLPTSTPATALGKPIPVLGPNSAFKSAAPTTPRRGFFGVGGTPGGTPGDAGAAVAKNDPHASLFAEKSRQAVLQQQGQGQKGVLGKVSDAIFGW